LTTNFRTYRQEIDSAIKGLRETASLNDRVVAQKLDEMTEVTGRMRWVMNIEDVVHQYHRTPVPPPQQQQQGLSAVDGHMDAPATTPNPPSHKDDPKRRSHSPTKGLLTKHRRKDSTKTGK
jgi:hypothetical protein